MKLLLKTPDADEALALLRENLTTEWRIDVSQPAGGISALGRELADADAVVAMAWPADAPPAPRLRLLQLPGAGLDQIDFAAVPPKAAICNVFEHEIGIAEYVLATILEWLIGIRRMDSHLRQGDWRDSLHGGGPLHGELQGKTIGIIGYGRIGREVAKRAKPFGVRIIACTRSPDRPEGRAHAERVDGMDRLGALLAESDFVLVACPLDQRTRGLIDRDAFRRMKPTGVIINVARGPVIDEDALYDACRERRIGGAIIDTWYRYPKAGDRETLPSRHPFQELDNIIMTPHISGWSAGLLVRRFRVIAQNLDHLARGEPLLNLVRPPETM